MNHIPALCARITVAISQIESTHPKNSTIESAIRDLRWAEGNVRNQAAWLERELKAAQRELQQAQQEIARLNTELLTRRR
jgi:uncharacterized protein involved in exopolysaccharide biosynthesis